MSTNLGAKFVVRFPPNSAGESEAILFSDVKRMNSKLRTLISSQPLNTYITKFALTAFRYWALPNLDPCWKALENSSLASVQPLLVDDLDLSENCVAEEVTINTAFELKHTPCPVNSEKSESWSNAERGKASRAKVVDSLTDLKETVKDIKVLTIRDANGELISMVITNIAETLPHLPEAGTTIVSAIMEGEDIRYTEQGTDAPDGVHPNRLRREGASKVNFKKGPRPSKE
ncbi:hypothetical protein B0H14DRAFT_2634449 [Mycena olivaceomarginata]|nr:hypothetical protein B0H14DRAFT_2634449 [Mycena olivaceomarginata]